MKKHLVFLLTSILLGQGLLAQLPMEKDVTKKNPHLTIRLQNDIFYYSKGVDTGQLKIAILDSVVVAKIIDIAIAENKVAPKALNVVLEGDDLLMHPQFEMLLNTILSKTVSEVRLKTNVFE